MLKLSVLEEEKEEEEESRLKTSKGRKQDDWTSKANSLKKSLAIQSHLIFHTSFDSNIRLVYFRTKGTRVRVYFPATYFFVFCSPNLNCSNSFLVFVNVVKDNAKTLSYVKA